MRSTTIVCLLLLLLLLNACNRHALSRGKAASIIEKNQSLPKAVAVEIFKKYLIKEVPKPIRGFANITLCVFNGEKYSDVQTRLQDWQTKGLIAVGETYEGGTCPAQWATVSLTNEGRKYITSESGGSVKSFL